MAGMIHRFRWCTCIGDLEDVFTLCQQSRVKLVQGWGLFPAFTLLTLVITASGVGKLYEFQREWSLIVLATKFAIAEMFLMPKGLQRLNLPYLLVESLETMDFVAEYDLAGLVGS